MKFSELKDVMNINERLDLTVTHYSKDGGFSITRESYRTHAVPDDILDSDVGSMYITAGGSLHINLLKREEL